MALREALFFGLLLAANKPIDPSLAETIARLASADRATRVDAERTLIDQGPAILDRLPEPDTIDDPAVRAAIDRVRTRLEHLRAEQAIVPRRLTLRGKGAASDVLATLVRDEQIVLTPGQADRRIAVFHDDQPFWTVIDDIAAQLDAWPAAVAADGRLLFRDRVSDDNAKRVAYDGAFRVEVGPATMRPIAGDDTGHLIRVPVELRAEPRLRPLFAMCAATDFALETGDGEAMPAFSPQARYELPFGERGDAVAVRLDFVADKDALEKSLTLSGMFRVTIAAAEEPFAFALDATLTKRVEQSRAGVTVEVRKASRDDETVRVELAVIYEHGGPAFESYRTWVYHNVAGLEYDMTADGKQVTRRLDHEPTFSTIAATDGGVLIGYRFEGLPADATNVRIVYHAPTKIIETLVRFRMDDLPLNTEGRSSR